MVRTCLLVFAAALIFTSTLACGQEAKPEAKTEKIDFNRARELVQKRTKGEKLTAEEEAFVKRAMDAYQAWQLLERLTGGGERPENPRAQNPAPPRAEGKSSVGFKPLTEMSAEDKYKGEDGGLYGGGKNEPPNAHRELAADESAKIQPLNA